MEPPDSWVYALFSFKDAPVVQSTSYFDQLLQKISEFFFGSNNNNSTRPLIGLGVVTGIVCGLIYWSAKCTIQASQSKNEVNRVTEEMNRLSTHSRQLALHSSNLKKKSDRLQEENERAVLRVQSLENKVMELVAVIMNQNPSSQLNMVKSIYKEQILELVEENTRLKKKNEVMRDELECSVCMSQEANCVLRPCGHSICTECYYEIRRNADLSSKLPLCPFCRKEVQELMPKFNS